MVHFKPSILVTVNFGKQFQNNFIQIYEIMLILCYMHAKSYIALAVLTFFLVCFDAEGAGRRKNWDRILDRYEALCNECMDMKNRIDAGEKISSKDISKLLNSLGRIREELSSGSGSMTQEQISRFESIRDTFVPRTEGRDDSRIDSGKGQIADAPESAGVTAGTKSKPKAVKETQKPEAPSKATERRKFQDIPQMRALSGAVEFEDETSITRNAVGNHRAEKRLMPAISASALMSVLPDPAYGFMLTISGSDAAWGAYAKFLSNFKNAPYGYECRSTDGSLWLSGNSNAELRQFSAGVTGSISARFGAFAGMGYGSYTTTWEDSFGQWMRVTDHSTKGLLLEAGLSCTFGKFRLTGGASVTAFHYTNLFLGVGLQF